MYVSANSRQQTRLRVRLVCLWTGHRSCCPSGHRDGGADVSRYTRWMTHGRRNIVSLIRRGVRVGWQPGLTGLSRETFHIFLLSSFFLFLRWPPVDPAVHPGHAVDSGINKEDSGPITRRVAALFLLKNDGMPCSPEGAVVVAWAGDWPTETWLGLELQSPSSPCPGASRAANRLAQEVPLWV